MLERNDYYKVNGVAIKRPSTFKVEKYKITNAARLANGDMVADVLNRKRKFYFTYKALTAKELDNILNVLWENDDYFFTFEYVHNGQPQSAVVYPSALPAELHNTSGEWVWKNVTFSLIER